MMQLAAFAAGLACGVLSGFGVGGGTLLMIYMVNIASLPQSGAQGINLLYFLPTSLSALISHVKNKLIDLQTAVPAVIAGVLCSLPAAFAAVSADTAVLEKLFGAFLLLTGGYEFLKKDN